MDIRRVSPDLKILVVTMHADRVLADACMQAGAVGFILKDADVSELLCAIRAVPGGVTSRRFSRATHRSIPRLIWPSVSPGSRPGSSKSCGCWVTGRAR